MPRSNGPHARIISPSGSGSTLTTSAPRSARIMVQKGPARARDRSSTRMPVSGKLIGKLQGSDLLGQHLAPGFRSEVGQPDAEKERDRRQRKRPANGVG